MKIVRYIIVLIALNAVFPIGLKALIVPQTAEMISLSSSGIAGNIDIGVNPASIVQDTSSISFSSNEWLGGLLGSKVSYTKSIKNSYHYFSFEYLGIDDIELRDEQPSDLPDGYVKSNWIALDYANILGTKHHNVYADSSIFRELLPLFVKYADQPFAVPSGLGILAISELANNFGIKVLLSGDCADECFGGYSWYPYLSKVDDRSGTERNTSTNNDITYNCHGINIRKRLEAIRNYSPQKRAWAWHYYASENEKIKLFNKDFFYAVQSSEVHFNRFNSTEYWEPEEFIRQDRNYYLKNEMLQKLDRMTMANSVEGRVPFCSPEIINFSDKLDFNHMVKGNEIKWILKKAFSGYIPENIIKRKKHGFNVPIDHWLRNEWSDLVERTFSTDSKLMELGIITRKSLNVALEMVGDTRKQNGPTIFSYIILNLWLENFYGNNC